MATKTRKQPTEEQKAAAAAKREKFRQLCKMIGDMSEDARMLIVDKIGGVINTDGRKLSVFNSCLLASQLPTVSQVGGFQQWRRIGRKVKKGERGLSLWIPCGGGGKAEGGPADVANNGEPIGDATDKSGSRFMMGYVWDISQTEEIPADDTGAETEDNAD